MTYVVDCVHFLWPTMSLFSSDRVPKTGELLFTLHKIPKSDQQERSYQKPTLLSTPPNCHCHNFKLDYTSGEEKNLCLVWHSMISYKTFLFLCFEVVWSLNACLVLELDIQNICTFLQNTKNQTFKMFLQLCSLKEVLDLKVFSQVLQPRKIPSKWWTSMWSLIALGAPSLPHTLHIFALIWPLPCGSTFGPASIIDLTRASISCASIYSGIAIFWSLLLATFDNCWSV